MAENFRFVGINRRFTHTAKNEDGSPTGIPAFSGYETPNQGVVYSAWRLSEAEVEQVIKTGMVWVAQVVRGCLPSPLIVGSRSYVIRHAIDFGGMWGGSDKPPIDRPKRVEVKPKRDEPPEPA